MVEEGFKSIIDESSTKTKSTYNNRYDLHVKSNYRISNEMQVFQFLQRSPNFMGFIHTGSKHVTGQWYGPVIKLYDYNYRSNATFADSVM